MPVGACIDSYVLLGAWELLHSQNIVPLGMWYFCPAVRATPQQLREKLLNKSIHIDKSVLGCGRKMQWGFRGTPTTDKAIKELLKDPNIQNKSHAINTLIERGLKATPQLEQPSEKQPIPESKAKTHKEKEQLILDSGSWIKETKPDKQGYQWRYVGTYQCDPKRKGQTWCDRLHDFEEAYYFAELKKKFETQREERKLTEPKPKPKAIKRKHELSIEEIIDQTGICVNPILIRQNNPLACALCEKKDSAKRQACDQILHELKISPVAYKKFIESMTAKQQDWWQGKIGDILLGEDKEFLAFEKRYQEVCEPCEEHKQHRCTKYCNEFYEPLRPSTP